jgi:Na+/melibiose symporter-like transporter
MSDVAVGKAHSLAYAFGGLGTGIINSVPTLLLLFFATEILRIPAGTAALIILVPKLWIIFWEPLVGNWSDRSNSRWGRRSPFMLTGALILTVAFALLFAPPSLGPGGMVAWVAAAYFILMSGFSLYFVPYVAIPAEIVAGATSRSRLVSWRMTFAMLGALISATMAPIIVSAGGGGAGGYRLMAALVGPICLVAMLLPLFTSGNRTSGNRETVDLSATPSSATGLWSQFRRAVADRPFRLLAIVQMMQVAAIGSTSAGMPYLIINYLHRPSADVGWAFCAQLLPAVFAIPLFTALGRRIGHVRGQILAACVFALGAVVVGLMIYIGTPWLAIVWAMPIIGLGFGGMQGQSFTLSADFIHAANKSGDAGASLTGMWTASEKVGLALGPAATGSMLALLGKDLILWQITGPAIVIMISVCLLLSIINKDRQSSRKLIQYNI